jgi:hypothetical protein
VGDRCCSWTVTSRVHRRELVTAGHGVAAYDVRIAFSRDRGRTWSASVTPHHDGTQTEHGFASLFPMPGQGLGVAWLDGRQMKAGAHEGMGAGDMSLRNAMFGPDGNQASEMAIDDRVCECCPSAAAVTADGPIVAFRNRTSDEIRDIYVSRLVGGKWTEPRAVHNDNWRIAACPVNGPALSAKGRDVAIAWFTAVGEEGHVYAAFSSNAGETFGSPVHRRRRRGWTRGCGIARRWIGGGHVD